MTDETTTYQDRLRRDGKLAGRTGKTAGKEPEDDSQEASCRAFGYLRGIRDNASAIEFRFRNGNSVWFPYTWMGNWQFNPSEGLLLKFSGDVVYLVLIRGSNLDRPLHDGTIDLTHAGLQRHRVLWIREMTDEDIRKVGEAGPTIDSIELAEFKSHDALNEWVDSHAPGFHR
jgi:hypothetical protein